MSGGYWRRMVSCFLLLTTSFPIAPSLQLREGLLSDRRINPHHSSKLAQMLLATSSGHQQAPTRLHPWHTDVQQLPPSGARQLPEQRSHARLETRMDAVLHLNGRTQRIVIHDISRGGLKLEHAFGLNPGDVITIELLSRRTFEGKVAWMVAPYTGITFEQPLAENDPSLFATACLKAPEL